MLMGEATRLPDKPFVDYHGKPLFMHGWEVLEEVFNYPLIACTPGVEEKLKSYSVPYVVDELELGPLSGILTGFQRLSSEYVFVVGCDMPHIRADLINHLIPEVVLDGLILTGKKGFKHPLHAFYSREKTLKVVEDLLGKDRRILDLCESLDVEYYSLEKLQHLDPHCTFLKNINTPEDLKRQQ